MEVDSKHIKSIDYDEGLLTVVFHHGGAYNYENVPQQAWDELLISSSKSEYFRARIKNKYKTTKKNVVDNKILKEASSGRYTEAKESDRPKSACIPQPTVRTIK